MVKNWFTFDGDELIEYDSVDKFPKGCIGFVYEITNTRTGKFYIGKKSLFSNTKKRLTKKEIAEHTGPGKKPTKKLVTKESNWLDYWGSNKTMLKEIEESGTDIFRRKILKFCFNKKQLTYWEVHFQCVFNVLLIEDSYNDNVLAKFFRRDLIVTE
jgi:hypothetical protein